MNKPELPRTIDPAKSFDSIVQWYYDEIIMGRGAPGLIVGLSGTDSLVCFCAAAKAYEKAGKPNRAFGVHFAPSEDFIADNPDAEVHLWFRDEVMPWLGRQYPQAKLATNYSIDWRHDGLRWGALMDLSVVTNEKMRGMRPPSEQYWVVGTRNLTEDTLLNYSNASTVVSVQPIIHLWKSEILKISEYLGIPQIAIAKSCETDCICGRLRLPARHIPEVDALLMVRRGELADKYIEENISEVLRKQLVGYIENQIATSQFKKKIPYTPDPLVMAFENGSLNLKEFNHHKHLYIAWYYLRSLPLDGCVTRYAEHLKPLLEAAGQSHRFNLELTRAYFYRLLQSMRTHCTETFEELVEKDSLILAKISA